MYVPAEEIKEKFGYFDLYSVRRAAKSHGIACEVKDGVLWVDYDEFYDYHANKAPNQHTYFEKPDIELFNKHIVIHADRAVLTSDWHTPFFDEWLSNAMLWICKLLNIQVHLCLGDLFDQKEFAKFINYEGSDWKIEKDATYKVGRVLTNNFLKNQIRYIESR